jgi:23S rRNA pseudouridine1911/1915/1917 synthase
MSDQVTQTITRSWIISDKPLEIRLDAFVRRCMPHLSRREALEAIRSKLFRINERVGAKGTRLAAGDRVTFEGPRHWLLDVPPPQPQLSVPVLYEDTSVLVVDKPAGMATHGFSGRDHDTLANFLATARPDLLFIGASRWEPGLVHRLDRETSGVVLIAKTQAAFDALRLQFRLGQVQKKYWALVWGKAENEGSISCPLAHDRRDKRRMQAMSDHSLRVKKQKSWSALTRFRKLTDTAEASLLEIQMETGVTHQIRAHLAAIGHPIVGDSLYGARRENFGLQRQFLHAFSLEFVHPEGGQWVKAEAPLPLELEVVLKKLRAKR